MAYSLVANTAKGSVSGATVTTDAIDTSGASLLVVGICWYNNITATPTLTDSKSNPWQLLTVRTIEDSSARIFYAYNPTVGSGHTFTYTGSLIFAGIAPSAFSGALATSGVFDVENGATIQSTSVQPGAANPNEDNELIFTMLGRRDVAEATTHPSGFTELDDLASSAGNALGIVTAYQVQTTATSVDPTWSWATSDRVASGIGAFKAAAPGGGSSLPHRQSDYAYAHLLVR